MQQQASTPSRRVRPQFLSRELGMLEFNRRVLAQAEDRRVPTLERLRFLCLVSSNLDEFFEIRVAEVKEKIKLGKEIEITGEMPASDVFAAVSERAHGLVADQYRVLNEDVFPALAGDGVLFLSGQQWTREQRAWLREYFVREMMP